MKHKYCLLAVFVLAACGLLRVHGDACEHEPNEHDYCYDATCGLPITNPNVFHPCECTQENIGYEFTECNTTTNTRNLVYYWKPPATCYGGVSLPNHLDNVPCSVSCGAGQHLDLTTHTCADCAAGSYSPGGGMVWDNWDTIPAQFETECAVGSLSKTCTAWRPRGSIIDSGNQSDSLGAAMESVLSLQFHLVAAGSIKFAYKVSAENYYDYLMFVVDDLVWLQKSNQSWTTYTQSLSVGYHFVQWVYYKDETVSAGEDKATIQNITITGLTVANLDCRTCAPGKYAGSSAAACLDCPSNTYSTGNATECTPCPAGQHSYPASASCTGHTNCTSEDYTYTLSQCVNGLQTKTYRWISPPACVTADSTLPPTETISCAPLQCPAGTSLTTSGDACAYCADGTANADPTATGCAACPSGQLSGSRIAYFNQWDTWYPNFTTGCTGDCLSNGWRLGSYFIDSGAGAGPGASTWVEFPIATVGNYTTVTFNYSISCSVSDTVLYFHVNDSIVHQEMCSGCNSSWAVYSINLTAGLNTLKWTYHKGLNTAVDDFCDRALIYQITVNGVTAGMGGAAKCFSCAAGQYSGGNGVPYCVSCPGGSYTSGGDSVTCSTCASNTYAPPGSTQCYPCPHATTAPPGAESCSYDCAHLLESILSDSQGNLNITDVYDITGLAKTNYTVPDGVEHANKDFVLNLCTPRSTPCEPNSTTFACMYGGFGAPVDIGNAIGFYQNPSSAKGLVVAFSNPVTNCAANITLHCDPTTAAGYPVYNLNASDAAQCRFNFDFSSVLACPVCGANYYFSIESPCINGKITTSHHWLLPKMCHDGVTLPASSYVTCSSSEETVPIKQSTVIGIVFGVGGFVILAAAGIAYLYISRKKVQAKYNAIGDPRSRPLSTLNPTESTNAPGSPAYSLE